MMQAQDILLFQNLAEFEYEGVYYDFHNDYECSLVEYDGSVLRLVFVDSEGRSTVSIRFQNTKLERVHFTPLDTKDTQTIDLMYRGRAERDGEHVEYELQRAYFYLEFYEGLSLEFWSESLILEQE